MKAKKTFLFITLILFLGVGAYFGQQYYGRFQKAKQERLLYEARKTAWQALQQSIKSEIGQFKGEVGIVIKDLETGWEFSFEKAKLFPSASLAKIPIMAACFLAAEEGKLKLNQNIKLKPSDKLSGSGILKTTYPDIEYSVEELIGFMIYESDNTATNILTNMLGIDYLNNSFRVFGLKNTNLSRKVADYQSRNRGIENYTTAQDMALILEKIYRRNLVNKSVSKECIGLLKLQRITDRIPKYLPVDITVAHKSGLERGICHDAGIVFTRRGDFLISILTKHKDSNSILSKEFIATISLHTYNYFEQVQ